jgi:hypothetical protein
MERDQQSDLREPGDAFDAIQEISDDLNWTSDASPGEIRSTRRRFETVWGEAFESNNPRLVVVLSGHHDPKGFRIGGLGSDYERVTVAPISFETQTAHERDIVFPNADESPLDTACMIETGLVFPMLRGQLGACVGVLDDNAFDAVQRVYSQAMEYPPANDLAYLAFQARERKSLDYLQRPVQALRKWAERHAIPKRSLSSRARALVREMRAISRKLMPTIATRRLELLSSHEPFDMTRFIGLVNDTHAESFAFQAIAAQTNPNVLEHAIRRALINAPEKVLIYSDNELDVHAYVSMSDEGAALLILTKRSIWRLRVGLLALGEEPVVVPGFFPSEQTVDGPMWSALLPVEPAEESARISLVIEVDGVPMELIFRVSDSQDIER